MRLAVLVLALAVGGCEQPQPGGTDLEDKAKIAELSNRVVQLEAWRDKTEATAKAPPPSPRPAAPKAEPLRKWELVGGGQMMQARRFYPTRDRCEEAKQVLLEDVAAREEEARRRGAIYSSPYMLSCIPV